MKLIWIASSRVSFETSFVSKQPKLEPKLVSALSETRRLFRLFRFKIKTGSFGVSKQPKQTKDKLKQQQICWNINVFNYPYHEFCLFRLFRYRSETSKQTENCFFLFSQKSKPKKNRNRLSFRFVSVRTEKKNNGFKDPLIENVFCRFFSVCFEKILSVSVVLIMVRNTETNQKKCFLVSRNKQKNNRNRLSFGLFQFEPKKKIWSFRGHPTSKWEVCRREEGIVFVVFESFWQIQSFCR